MISLQCASHLLMSNMRLRHLVDARQIGISVWTDAVGSSTSRVAELLIVLFCFLLFSPIFGVPRSLYYP